MPGGGLRQRWKSRSGTIYEWDYQQGRVEVYDPTGSARRRIRSQYRRQDQASQFTVQG